GACRPPTRVTGARSPAERLCGAVAPRPDVRRPAADGQGEGAGGRGRRGLSCGVRIASLTLQGFKSFGDRTTIEFSPGVTAIVGPNGSGKSNIIDALRWATGGGRATAFRAEEKTELIFHGASGKRSVSLAEVEVELAGPRGTVKVWRSLDRDGNTRLRLNGRASRFLDGEEALAGSGLGRSGLAVIGQGEVSQVLMADPERLLEYVAEAAGAARLATRRDQAAERLEAANR